METVPGPISATCSVVAASLPCKASVGAYSILGSGGSLERQMVRASLDLKC